jgi:transposase-like protein
LLAGYKGPEDLIGEQGLLKQLTRALVERALHAELTHHLGYEKHDPEGRLSGNSRNPQPQEVEGRLRGLRRSRFRATATERSRRRLSRLTNGVYTESRTLPF